MKINLKDYLHHYQQYFKLFAEYAPKHMVDYVGGANGLPNGMASSLECCIELAKIVQNKNAVILNAGAGASSWVLRKIFPNMICTDPDAEYLQVVKQICEIGGLSTQNFIPINFSEEVLKLSVDYCLYDFGNIQRIPFLKNHVQITKKALYIDDTDDRIDCQEYRNYVYNNFKDYELKDCIEASDVYGRWGIILKK